MDAKELAAFLAAFDTAQSRADAALRLYHPGLPYSQRDNAVRAARKHLAGMRAMMERVEKDEHMRRRELLKLLPALAISPAALERISVAHAVDAPLLDAYEEVLVAAVRAFPRADMRAYFGTLQPYVMQMSSRLSAPMTRDMRYRLARLVGRTAMVASHSAAAVGDDAAANSMTMLLHETARTVNDGELLALAYYARANLHSSLFQGQWQYSPVAVFNVEAALQALGPTAPNALRRALLCRYARETAMAGGTAFLHALEQARQVPAQDVGPGLYEPGCFFPATVGGLHTEGVGRAVLGHTDRAEQALRDDIAETSPDRVKAHSWMLADLSNVHIRQREPEQAAATASRALDLALSVNSTLNVRRVRYAAAGMRQWDIPSVRTLRERLAAAS
jgi:hypothetical protein